jgi:hypothetical protein
MASPFRTCRLGDSGHTRPHWCMLEEEEAGQPLGRRRREEAHKDMPVRITWRASLCGRRLRSCVWCEIGLEAAARHLELPEDAPHADCDDQA